LRSSWFAAMTTNLAPQLASGVPTSADIRAAKPPVEIPNAWMWFWVTLAVLAVAAAAWWFWRRWRDQRLAAPPILVIPPHVRARERLEAACQFFSDPNRFCTLVADAIRVYLEERFNLKAPERTTEEFLVELQASSHLTRDQKQSLGEFLQSCDLVKFARFEPNETSLRLLHEAALRLVDETQFDPVTKPPVAPAAASALSGAARCM
jgi:hypothetical protein